VSSRPWLLLAGLAVVGAACSGGAPVAAPGPPPRCVAADLAAKGGWQGATGSMLGEVAISNVGRSACTLKGYADLQLLGGHGEPLTVVLYHASQDRSGGVSGPTVTDPHAVTIAAGALNAAVVWLQWSNWCQTTPESLSARLLLPGGGVVAVAPGSAGLGGVPRCDSGPGSQSALNESPITEVVPE